ncbi:WecB/TagA/CpsF family glycosyltransferase [Flavivirga aquimarina]|uniref:WecB/TagA/CpsF family glycosyltransferase n=1 Tax=Flavivirga aquimarina TaxID=2027862 RepID=A0ABT8W741_9FLAO|nr:WecB/TagA/CpsF family glycosyltransferase [Flavivirga aquimarina]MDO5968911.1 WecB/TagA/CpsF family glycosyltransferase [Flavivirga aquimarina]
MEFKILNGVKTYAPTSKQELIEYAFNKKNMLIAVNAEKILHSSKEIKNLINENIGYPDGYGAVLILRKKGNKNAIKVPGCELWLQIIESYYKTKSFYLIGAEQHVVDSTVKKLKEDFKGVNICNYRNGYIKTEQEKQDLIKDIKEHKPDVVFIAMGSPRQEQFMKSLQKEYKTVYQGLGGSFDVYTGRIKRASKWWRDNNLEWANRLIKQPSRIKRQIHLVRFVFNLVLKY